MRSTRLVSARIGVALVCGALACVPTSQAEPAPKPASSSALESSRASAPDPADPADPVGAQADNDDDDGDGSPAAPEVADSVFVPGVTVDPDVQPGLAAFARELEAGDLSELGLAPGGALWIGKLEGNGGRDVLVYIPPGADPAAPFELVFHFHGTYSEAVAKQTPDMDQKREWVGWERLGQTLAAITELQAKRAPNVAVVYPISAGKRLEPGHQGWSNVAYDRMWMDGAAPPDYRDDFAKLHAEVVAILTEGFGVHPSKLPEGVIAEGHSAGGIALLNIAIHGALHVREFIFLDASFQGWADACFAAVEAAGAPAKLTLVVTDKGMADPFEGREPWCVDMAADAQLWADKADWCAARAGTRDADKDVPGSDWNCAELEERATQWRDDYADWCAAMKDNMRSVPGVLVVETKVFHKDQPRHFCGGLELDPDRWANQ